MANTYPTTFRFGPCAGQTKRLSKAEIDSGVTTCGGAPYVIAGTLHGTYTATYQPDPDSTAAANGARSISGWQDLANSVGGPFAQSLKRSQTARAAALRRLR